MYFKDHIVEELVQDESFRDYALNKDEEHRKLWEKWLEQNPDKRQLAEEACFIVQSFKVKQIEAAQEKIEKDFEVISQAFSQKFPKKEEKTEKPVIYLLDKVTKVAAIALIFLMVGLGAYHFSSNQNHFKQYTTLEGEIEKIQLPDGSTVYLNEKSTLAFNETWKKSKLRQVELTGEAYFKVAKRSLGREKIKFLVHAGDISVEVLGTEFNVNNTQSGTMVVLNSGKIRLKAPDKIMQMKPGDVVEYQSTTKKLTKSRSNQDQDIAWTRNVEKSKNYTTRGITPSSEKKDKNRSGNSNSTTKNGIHTNAADNHFTHTEENFTANAGNSKTENRNSNSHTVAGIQSAQATRHSGGGGGHTGNSKSYYITNPGAESHNTQGGNHSEIFQQGENNEAYIEQIGKGLDSRQNQVGNENTARTEYSGANIQDNSDDFEWSTNQEQHGQGNVSIFSIMNSYNTNIYTVQQGEGNRTRANVEGEDNLMIILQQGDFNQVIATQKGMSNDVGISPLDPGVIQNGQFNEAELMQHGKQNAIRVNQQGNNNKVDINQNDKKNF